MPPAPLTYRPHEAPMRQIPAVLLVLLMIPFASVAQPAPFDSPLDPGTRALSFDLPDGSGARFGYWRMRSDRQLMGWFFGLNASHSEQEAEGVGQERHSTSSSVQLAAGPALRYYLNPEGRVVPFVAGDVAVGYGLSTGDDSQRERGFHHRMNLSTAWGIGLEWFPADRISISGTTGLRAGGSRDWSERDNASHSAWQVRLMTFTSALTITLFVKAPEAR